MAIEKASDEKGVLGYPWIFLLDSKTSDSERFATHILSIHYKMEIKGTLIFLNHEKKFFLFPASLEFERPLPWSIWPFRSDKTSAIIQTPGFSHHVFAHW
jgi:hypothetical protein